LYELRKNKRKILTLFPSSDHHVTIEAVIEGNCKGKILVDTIETPKTAAVWTAPGDEALVYLGGAHDNRVYNEQLLHYFNDVIKPVSISQGLDAFQFYPSGLWEHNLHTVCTDEITIKDRDSYYRLNPDAFKRRQPTWRESIPDGFSLKRVESKDIFEKARNINVFDGLTSWKSFDRFQKYGIGYYLVEDATDTVVSGCITKVVAVQSRRCEVAIGTDEHFRKRGFATVVACATVSEALKRGLEVIWECFRGNTASIKTNQKVGFEYICDENFHLGFLYESLQNLLYLGYHHLILFDDPQKAAHWFLKALAKSEAESNPIPSRYNFYAACAFAAVEEYSLAIERLHAALDQLQDPEQFYDQLRSEKALDNLRGLQDFDTILQRLEKRIEPGEDDVL
jgi:RimJ/RimL family protein N-acetyltransferase